MTKPATPRYQPRHVPYKETWQDLLRQRQPRSGAPGQWTYVAPSSQNSSSSSRSTPPQNRQPRPTTGTWKQNRAAVTGDGFQEAPTSSSGNVTMPIEEALKRLYKDLSTCRTLCVEYQRTFDEHAGQLLSRVKDGTLDQVWRDMIAHHDADRFRDVTNKVRSRMRDLRNVLETSQPDNVEDNHATKQDAEVLERRERAAAKALQDCDRLVELFYRARIERKACNLLVGELNQVTGALDPNKNAALYRDSEEVNVDATKGKAPAQGRQNMKGQGTQKGKAPMKREGNAATGSFSPENPFGTTNEGNHQENVGTVFGQEQMPNRQQDGNGDRWGPGGTG